MQGTSLPEKSTTDVQPGTLLAAGTDYPQTSRQGNGDAIHTTDSKIRSHALELKQHRPMRFGLPCANCKAYYASDLPACPLCKCAERVPAEEAKAANRLKKQSAGVLQNVLGSFIHLDSTPGCKPPMRLALHGEGDQECFLWESRSLLCAHSNEIDAGHISPCILDENHDTQSEHASICLSCYNRLREKLARTEAALFIDLREASQIVYEAVWTDPSPADPSRTYQSAAQALLSELCQRAGVVRLPDAT